MTKEELIETILRDADGHAGDAWSSYYAVKCYIAEKYREQIKEYWPDYQEQVKNPDGSYWREPDPGAYVTLGMKTNPNFDPNFKGTYYERLDNRWIKTGTIMYGYPGNKLLGALINGVLHIP